MLHFSPELPGFQKKKTKLIFVYNLQNYSKITRGTQKKAGQLRAGFLNTAPMPTVKLNKLKYCDC